MMQKIYHIKKPSYTVQTIYEIGLALKGSFYCGVGEQWDKQSIKRMDFRAKLA